MVYYHLKDDFKKADGQIVFYLSFVNTRPVLYGFLSSGPLILVRLFASLSSSNSFELHRLKIFYKSTYNEIIN
jgi:hypothetical protein